MKPKTHFCIILDKSGSMQKTREQTIANFNEQIQELKEMSKEQDILFSLVSFNGKVYEHFWDQPINDIKEINENDYDPVGATALRDALGYTLTKLQENEEKGDNVAYLVVLISDGETTSDKNYKGDEGIKAIKEIVSSLDARPNWTISYIGCNKQNIESFAKDYNFKGKNLAHWDSSDVRSAKRSLSNVKTMNANYFKDRQEGLLKSDNYTCSVESAEFGDDLTKVDIKKK